MEENDSLDEIVKNNDYSGKRNNVGIVSENSSLIDIFCETLTRKSFNLTTLSIDDLAKSDQNFYFVDLEGFENYYGIIRQIKSLREQSPDSELILLHTSYTLSRPHTLPLDAVAKSNLVPVYERPLPRGASDLSRDLQKFAEEILLDHMNKFLSKPTMIEVGGSIFGLYKANPNALKELLKEIKKLHSQSYPIILTVGGGPVMALENLLSETYGTNPFFKEILERQARIVADLLSDIAEYIPSSRLSKKIFTDTYLRDRIPVVSLSGMPSIPTYESDTRTLRIAENLGLYKVIFAKDTDGVYEQDPYSKSRAVGNRLGFISLPTRQHSRSFPHIYASQILNGGINRMGLDGKGEHLMETGALFYLMNKTQHVRSIQVINGTKPELLHPALDGDFTGSYILKG
jgi:uridylate kinase